MSSTATLSRSENAPGYFKPRRLGHVNLFVSKVDPMMDFYTRILGIEEVYRTPLVGGGFLSNGNTHHDVGFTEADGPLGKPRNARPGTLNHLGIELGTERELVDSYERALNAGHKFMRTADHDIAHSVYGVDPDGNVYELYSDVVVDWRNQRSGNVTKPKVAWTPGATPIVEAPCYHENPEIRRVDNAVFNVRRTTHATLVTSKMEAMVEHYTTIVGLQVLDRKEDLFVVLGGSCGERSVTLLAAGGPLKVGYHHVGFDAGTPDELAAAVERANDAGISVIADITHAGRRAVYVRDPEGFLVQLFSDELGAPKLDRVDPALALYML
jgi:catechol 2,3-dioxygenase